MTLVLALAGCQWGDEGKGKFAIYLCRGADATLRPNGADNAGHTGVINGKTYKGHIIPMGAVLGVKSALGRGVSVNPLVAMQEILGLHDQGIYPEIKIAKQAQVTCEWHKYFDVGIERLLGSDSVGTTRRGVGPSAEDKASRKRAVRIEDIIEPERCDKAMRRAIGMHVLSLVQMHPAFSSYQTLKFIDIMDAGRAVGFGMKDRPLRATTFHNHLERYAQTQIELFQRLGQFLSPYACDEIRNEIIGPGIKVCVIEPGQAFHIDPDQGTFPYNTSYMTTIAGMQQYAGLAPDEINERIGVFKAYLTRVGEGPFDTEENREIGNMLREAGHEYGTTTGRPRRCGWFDITQARESVIKQGIEWMILTKLDVLDGFEEIKAYEIYSDGSRREYVFEGWQSDTSHCRTYRSLPDEAKAYVRFLAKKCGTKIGIVSVGPDDEATIVMPAFKKRLKDRGYPIEVLEAA